VTAISLKLDGSLTAVPSPNGCPTGGGAVSGSTVIPLALRADNKSADTAPGNANQVIDSAAAFVALDLGGAFGRVLYVSMATDAPMDLRITFEVSAQVVLPLRGSLGPWELPAADRITALEVRGQGSFRWVVYGKTS
jgi:hypothetical protein